MVTIQILIPNLEKTVISQKTNKLLPIFIFKAIFK